MGGLVLVYALNFILIASNWFMNVLGHLVTGRLNCFSTLVKKLDVLTGVMRIKHDIFS